MELNQPLTDQLGLYYSHAIFGRSYLHVATYILQMLLKMHDTSYLVSQSNNYMYSALQCNIAFVSFCTEMIVGSTYSITCADSFITSREGASLASPAPSQKVRVWRNTNT